MTRTFSDGHPKVLPACNFLSQYYFYNIFLQKSCRFSLQTLTKFEAAKTGSGVGFLRLTAVCYLSGMAYERGPEGSKMSWKTRADSKHRPWRAAPDKSPLKFAVKFITCENQLHTDKQPESFLLTFLTSQQRAQYHCLCQTFTDNEEITTRGYGVENCAKLRMRNRLNSAQTSANRGSHKPILVQPTMCLVSFEKLIQIQEE